MKEIEMEKMKRRMSLWARRAVYPFALNEKGEINVVYLSQNLSRSEITGIRDWLNEMLSEVEQ